MDYERIIFTGHSIRQMSQRGLNVDDILTVIRDGDLITDYPDDKPYPSCLILGFIRDVPVHVVFAWDRDQQTGIVITAYIPDTELWSDDFKSRRTSS